jgi:hypothetical protein
MFTFFAGRSVSNNSHLTIPLDGNAAISRLCSVKQRIDELMRRRASLRRSLKEVETQLEISLEAQLLEESAPGDTVPPPARILICDRAKCLGGAVVGLSFCDEGKQCCVVCSEGRCMRPARAFTCAHCGSVNPFAKTTDEELDAEDDEDDEGGALGAVRRCGICTRVVTVQAGGRSVPADPLPAVAAYEADYTKSLMNVASGSGEPGGGGPRQQLERTLQEVKTKLDRLVSASSIAEARLVARLDDDTFGADCRKVNRVRARWVGMHDVLRGIVNVLRDDPSASRFEAVRAVANAHLRGLATDVMLTADGQLAPDP